MSPAPLVLVRVTVGAIAAARGYDRLRAGLDGAAFAERARAAIEHAPRLYAPIGEGLVLGHPDLAVAVAAWGQLLLGALLLFGALVRPAGTLLALLVLNGCFAGPEELRAYYLLLALCAAACAWGSAGRTAGLDRQLDASLPGWLTWAGRDRRRSGPF